MTAGDGPVTLLEVAVELYALPPSTFTAARNARAKQVRAGGDRELAGQIQALRKPTPAAWAVDLLVRHRPEQVEDLLALGARLLEAQDARAGDRLRDLAREQHDAMAGLREAARRLADDAGQRLGDAVDVPLDSTLRAAMSDPAAAAAVRSGVLVADLVSTGFGPVEVGDAVAVPDAPPLAPGPADAGARAPVVPRSDDEGDPVPLPSRRRTTPRAPSRPAPAPAPAPDDAGARRAEHERDVAARDAARRRERERAERDLAAAQDRAAEADHALTVAEAALQDATERRAALDAEVAEHEAELARARGRRDDAVREEQEAITVLGTAARAADTAGRRARAAAERRDAVR